MTLPKCGQRGRGDGRRPRIFALVHDRAESVGNVLRHTYLKVPLIMHFMLPDIANRT